MKTFKTLREELKNQLDEDAAIGSARVNRLSQGIGLRGKGEQHNGHEGASIEHDNHADEHKGTAAGKFHAKASMHHSNAAAALKKGNMTTSLKHSKLANDAAAKAKAAGGESSASPDVHKDHESEAKSHFSLRKPTPDAAKAKAARVSPAKAAVGKTVGKVKKIFGRK